MTCHDEFREVTTSQATTSSDRTTTTCHGIGLPQ
jgi:hypothetical protein